MKKIVSLLLVVLCLGAMVALSGCGEKKFEDDAVVVSYDYNRAILLDSVYSESEVITPIEKVEFRGNYTLVTIYYNQNGAARMITTGVNTVRLYLF